LLAVSAAFALSSSLGAGSLAKARLAVSAAMAAATTNGRIGAPCLIRPADARRGERRRTLRRDLAGDDVLVPERVVLLGPTFVDVAGPHRLVRAGDADRSHVGVTDEHRDDEHRRDGVEDVDDLHLRSRQLEPWHDLVEREAGSDDEHSEEEQPTPEDDLLAGVEATRRRVLAAEHAAGAHQPADVVARRQVAGR
jgi:hypothetical protein